MEISNLTTSFEKGSAAIIGSTPLAGVVAGMVQVLPEASHFRRYVANVTMTTKLKTLMESRHASIVYECGTRSAKPGVLGLSDGGFKMAADVRVAEYTAADFAGYAKRYTNFGGDFGLMDLAALVERLSAGIAHYGATGVLSRDTLTGGKPISLVAVSNATAPVCAGDGKIFVPNAVDGPTSSDSMAAIVYAAAGCDAEVVTDFVRLDSQNNVLLADVDGVDLAAACYHALRVIGGNYEAAGAGSTFAYAVTRGVHSEVTVVGHTDEGAYMRSVLRTGSFQIPYGGIDVRKRGYTGLPKPGNAYRTAFTRLTDDIALMTAALVGCSDPMVELDGNRFPTMFTAGSISTDEVGEGAVADALSRSQTARISDGCGEFVAHYVANLSAAFGLEVETGVNGGVAEKHMRACFSALAGTVERHVRHQTVTPFFWVEPTSIVPESMKSRVTEAGCGGPLGYPGHTSSMPLAVDVELVGRGATVGSFTYNHVNSRSQGYITYLNGHRSDGMANYRLRQADTEAWAQVGGESDSVRDTMLSGSDVGTMCWTRGQSPFPAPGELVYAGGRVGVSVKQYTTDEAWRTEPTHAFLVEEMVDGVVEMVVTRPQVAASGPSNWSGSAARRRRCEASRALELARLKYGGLADVEDMMPLKFAPPPARRKKGDAQRPSTSAAGGPPTSKSGALVGKAESTKTATGALDVRADVTSGPGVLGSVGEQVGSRAKVAVAVAGATDTVASKDVVVDGKAPQVTYEGPGTGPRYTAGSASMHTAASASETPKAP